MQILYLLNPERSELTLSQLAADVGVLQGLFNLVRCNSPAVLRSATESLRHLQDLFMFLPLDVDKKLQISNASGTTTTTTDAIMTVACP